MPAALSSWRYAPSRGGMAGGIKMANGTNPLRASPFPGTVGKAAALMRAQLVSAQEYCQRRESDNPPARNLGQDALCEVFSGERIVHHHSHRHDDVLTVLRLATSLTFGWCCTMSVKVLWWLMPLPRQGSLPPSIHIDSPGGKLEVMKLAARQWQGIG